MCITVSDEESVELVERISECNFGDFIREEIKETCQPADDLCCQRSIRFTADEAVISLFHE